MSIAVKIGAIPGVIKEVALNGDRTVQAAAAAAELSLTGYTITVNGSVAEANTTLNDGDRVLLTRNAKGN